MTQVSRRSVLAGVAALGRPGPALAGVRVACLDYGLAQTALALGLVPDGLPDPAGYRAWVIDPTLPPGVRDLGARTQPNLELLAALAPDVILAVPDHDPVGPQLARIAPVLRLPLQVAGGDAWALSATAARRIGALAGRPDAAERLIDTAEAACAAGRTALAGRAIPPLLLASFIDARHLSVYGAGGILDATLTRLGLHNAWTGPTGRWGSATAGLDALAPLGGAALFVIDPMPPDAPATLAASPLWQALPFVRAGRVARLPPVLMFGTLPAAMRLVDLLVPRLLDASGG